MSISDFGQITSYNLWDESELSRVTRQHTQNSQRLYHHLHYMVCAI